MDQEKPWQLCRQLSDEQIFEKIENLRTNERKNLVWFLSCLSEIDRRKSHAPKGYPSAFAYCVRGLGFSEDEAWRRVRAARVADRALEIYSLLGDGQLSLTVVSMIEPHLTRENAAILLPLIQNKGIREVEKLIANLAPKPDTADTMRRLPQAAVPLPAPLPGNAALPETELKSAADGASPPLALAFDPIARQSMVPSAPNRVHFSFTGSEKLRERLKRARELLWHKYPLGRLEDILLEMAEDYLRRHDPVLRLEKNGPRRPRKLPRSAKGPVGPKSRNIPGWIKDRVLTRDRGRCAFVSAEGRLCGSRLALEFDHIKPWALGGASCDPENIRLLCRGHNQHEAEKIFGRRDKRGSGRGPPD